jgi:DNA-binding MarR family transcriptional regulator
MYNKCLNMKNQYYHTVYSIITTGHWITNQISIELKEFGITEPQFNVLRILRGAKGEPVSVQSILERMVQKSSNVTRIIDKLLLKKLAERKECPSNRRKMDITITKVGLDLLKNLDKKVAAFHEPMKNNLDQDELETLEYLIRKLKATDND